MASTARNERDKVEHLDSDELIERKVTQLAAWIRESRFTIVFSGAGLSTSAGIPDFRSGINTMLPTGPGAWEAAAAGREAVRAAANSARWNRVSSSLKAIPTVSHMSLVALHERGLVNMHVSQNTDGLNRKSGFPPDKLAELHGNTNLEVCKRCKIAYLRDFRTREAREVHDHRTSRRCDDPSCRGVLVDSIINFGEALPERDLRMAFAGARRADLCICLGSSLTVTPAADVPLEVAERGGKLVIVKMASLRINGMVDDVVGRLMAKLDIPIPAFVLRRHFRITYTRKGRDAWALDLEGLSSDGKRFSYVTSASVRPRDRQLTAPPPTHKKSAEPFSFTGTLSDNASAGPVEFDVSLTFQGHYGEPALSLNFAVPDAGMQKYEKVVQMGFDPATGEWAVEKQAQVPPAGRAGTRVGK